MSRESTTLLAIAAISVPAMVLSAERQPDETGPHDDQRPTAVQLAQEGLLSGIAGDATAREQALRDALCHDPDCGLARWHLGEIRTTDLWLTTDQVEQQMAQDSQLQEYRELRNSAGENGRRLLDLAGWCHRNELGDAERLHLYQVLHSNSATTAEKKKAAYRLGLRSYRGMLLSPMEIDLLQQQADAGRKNLQKWAPQVEKWRDAIENGPARRRALALEKLRSVDSTAIVTLEGLLSVRSEQLAMLVVSVLGDMADHEATQSLVRHALQTRWPSVRDAATRLLKQRPLHDYAPRLLLSLSAPVQSRFFVNLGPAGTVRHEHQFFREGPDANLLFTASYAAEPQLVRINRINFFGTQPSGETAQALAARVRREQFEQFPERLAEARAESKLAAIEQSVKALRIQQSLARRNAAIAQQNQRVFETLEQTAGVELPRSSAAWWSWWQDYNELYRQQKPTYAQQVGYVERFYVPYTDVTSASCFSAGTPVRTQTGLVSIEKIRPGDRVLSQDIETGELAYKLILKTTVRPPSDLLRISVGGDTITTTKGHPFWVNNTGWRMAKRLSTGSQLHTIRGGQPIDGIESLKPAKAYNLIVADFATYFVGQTGVLVHDNTYRKPTTALTPGLLASHPAVPK